MTIQGKRKRASTRSERGVASRLGGRRVFNSGAGVEKGDVRVKGKYRIENKITGKSSYRLTALDWSKIRNAAIADLEEPIFHVRLSTGRELVVLGVNFAIALGIDFHDGGAHGLSFNVREDWLKEHHAISFSISGLRQPVPFRLVLTSFTQFLKKVDP